MKAPSDDTNPRFISSLTLTELFKVALGHIEQRSNEMLERPAGADDRLRRT